VTTHLILRCPSCLYEGFADDEYCESCGADLTAVRDAPRDHIELVTPLAAGVTDLGLRHARNEDALFLQTIECGTVAVVCDGVSSSIAPQLAAQVAAHAAGTFLVSRLESDGAGWSPHAAMRAALADAAREVVALPLLSRRSEDAPSCTIVAGVWDGLSATVAWSGDSRAYWIGEDGARQLTSDHSWAQAQVDAGLASAEQAMDDPRGHGITRWLGPDSPDELPPVVSFVPSRPGLLVLCSDGLWNYVDSADDLARRTEDAGEPTALARARALTGHALRSGGHDNVTVAVIEIVPARAAANDQEER
jgi:serine/threonine protein phosphatase PrpC